MATADYFELKGLNDNVLHPMSIPAMHQAEPLFLTRGKGVHVYDHSGRAYLDGMGGLWCVNVGHGREEMRDAINRQLGKLAYYSTFGELSNEPSSRLASRIKSLLEPEDVGKVFFSLGGSDAVETALKLSRQFWRTSGRPSKTRFISLEYGYHGVHFGGTSLSGMPAFKAHYEPLLPGCSQVASPFPYRNPWTGNAEELARICADILDGEIRSLGPENVAAFIAEPIQGAGGVIVPPANYWPLVREVCDRHDVLLIADEVVTGFGRSGCMFGARGWGVKPDVHCFAKGLTSGYVPLGATAVSTRIAAAFDQAPPDGFIAHGYTYSGHPLACAAALAAIGIVERESLVENAADVGDYLLAALQPLADRYPHLGEVRGKGLMVALDLVEDKSTREPVGPMSSYSDMLASDCQRNGVIVRPVGPRIILSPPLTFSKENADTLVAALDGAFSRVRLDMKAA